VWFVDPVEWIPQIVGINENDKPKNDEWKMRHEQIIFHSSFSIFHFSFKRPPSTWFNKLHEFSSDFVDPLNPNCWNKWKMIYEKLRKMTNGKWDTNKSFSIFHFSFKRPPSPYSINYTNFRVGFVDPLEWTPNCWNKWKMTSEKWRMENDYLLAMGGIPSG